MVRLLCLSLLLISNVSHAQTSYLLDSLLEYGRLPQNLSSYEGAVLNLKNSEQIFSDFQNTQQHGMMVVKVNDSLSLVRNGASTPIPPGRIFYFEIHSDLDSFSLEPTNATIDNSHQLIDSLIIYPIPDLHVVYTYPRFYRRKDEFDRPLNFFLDYYIRNLDTIRLGLHNYRATIKIQDESTGFSYSINAPPPKLSKHDHGFISTGRNAIESANIDYWDHTDPTVYNLLFQGETEANKTPQEVKYTIGFRDVVLNEDILTINMKKVDIRGCYLNDIDKISSLDS